jgi:FkbM family methyltransferase
VSTGRAFVVTYGPISLRQPSPRLVVARLLARPLPPIASNLTLRLLYPAEIGKRDAHPFVVRSLTGSRFAGRSDDFHARKFGVDGYSEWKLWAIALALCAPNDNIIEAGAHVGTETIGYADLVPLGRVFAFEPSPQACEALERTLAVAGAENVSIFPCALGDGEGTFSFALPASEISSGIGHLLGPEEARTKRIEYIKRPIDTAVIEVEVRTLDSMLDALPTIRLVCLDAEGAEPRILTGAAQLIERDRPSVVIEAYEPHLRRAGASVADLHRQLTDFGYRMFAIRHVSLVALPNPEPGRIFDNWFCLHAAYADKLEAVRRELRRCGLVPAIRTLNPLAREARKRRALAGR